MIQLIPAPSDLIDIAAYFAAQPVMTGTPAATAQDKIKRGAELFINERCIFCHEEGAKPSGPFTPGAPVIGGQHKQYLIKAMMDIRSQKRRADIYNLMYQTLSRLQKQDIELIAEYLSSL
jgi:cytochrome c553